MQSTQIEINKNNLKEILKTVKLQLSIKWSSRESDRAKKIDTVVMVNINRSLTETLASFCYKQVKCYFNVKLFKKFCHSRRLLIPVIADNHSSQITGKMEFHEVIDDLGGQFYMIPVSAELEHQSDVQYCFLSAQRSS